MHPDEAKAEKPTPKPYAGHIDQDPEMMATWKVLQMVGEFDHEAQKRIIAYVADRVCDDHRENHGPLGLLKKLMEKNG